MAFAAYRAVMSAMRIAAIVVNAARTASRVALRLRLDAQHAISSTRATPQPGGYREDDKRDFRVYTIRDQDGEVWKYGITSVTPFSIRPAVGVALCSLDTGGTCTHDDAEDVKAVGYYNARVIEAGLIDDYRATHNGYCPRGNGWCK